MGEVNPRLLAVILEDLQQELTRWATVASDTMATAGYTQRHAEEQVDQAHRHAAIVNDKAVNDRDAVENLRGQVEVLFSKCVEAKQLSHKTLAETTTALQKAQKTLSLWQTELEYALAWLARAEERVRRAEIELAAAEAELRRAESELSRAESAYRNCVNYRDDKGRRKDCSSEASRVRRAQEAVHDAVLRVKAAQLELAAAKAERERARARVKCCQTAVGIATKAVEFAQEAKERATMAVNASERSLETAQAAQRFMNQAVQKVTEEEEEADQMLKDVQLAANFTSEGQHHFRNAERSEESAQRLRIITRTELDNRIGLLYQLNKPDLSVGGGFSSSSSGIGVRATGGLVTTPTVSKSGWITKDTIMSVDDLPNPEDITGADDFQKVPMEQMQAGLLRLQEMQSAIESGEGSNGDYWSNRDTAEGLEYENGYRRIYDAFYGNDAIHITKNQGVYDITNGRHRIWLAKRMGLKFLPVRLVERSESRDS